MTYRTLILNALKDWFKNTYDNIVKSQKNYILIGVGNPPSNFKEVFNKIVCENSINVLFTFELIIIRFKTSLSLDEINKILERNFELQTFLLAKDDNSIRHYCSTELFEYLRMPHQRYTLEQGQNTVNEINYALEQAQNMENNLPPEMLDDTETSDYVQGFDDESNSQIESSPSINDILDKVNNKGYDFLNEEEKQILENYKNK